MIVVVDNLGPVRHAEIDLGKRLIVFAGPNHSGKTHVAWTIYGLLKRIAEPGPELGSEWNGLGSRLVEAGGAGLAVSEFADLAARSFEAEVAGGLVRVDELFAVSPGTYQSTQVELRLSNADTAGIARIDFYSMESQDAGCSVGLWFRDMKSALPTPTPPDRIVAGFGDGYDYWGQGNGKQGKRRSRPTPGEFAERPGALAKLSRLARRAATSGLEAQFPSVFTADRTAVSLFSRELAASRFGLVDDIIRLSAEPAKAVRTANRFAQRYPTPIMDSIQVANGLVDLTRERSRFESLAEDLETILGGTVDVSAEGEIGFTLAESGRPRVPFHVSASVVKSLASLVFYFRHQAQDGATLVIDEPELNLHPDLQRKVARFLAKAVNAGFRIILSTHSDYVLREFSNLVRLGAAGEPGTQLATELGYDPASTLKPDLVGVWHFDGGEAVPLEITGEGFNLASIEDAIMRQNMDTQRIEMAVGD